MLLVKVSLVLFLVMAFMFFVAVTCGDMSTVYDAMIIRMTKHWYAAVLGSVDDQAAILDVGIGTATALCEHGDLVKTKQLCIRGIDYEPQYIRTAKRRLRSAGLNSYVEVKCASIYDSEALENLKPGNAFDVAYFSGSLTLMPEPLDALYAAARVVKPNGTIHVTQTYQRRTLPFLKTLKPLLKYATTVDFGHLTTESQALDIFRSSKFTILRHEIIPGSIDTPLQAAYHTVLQVDHSRIPSGRT